MEKARRPDIANNAWEQENGPQPIVTREVIEVKGTHTDALGRLNPLHSTKPEKKGHRGKSGRGVEICDKG